MAVRRRELLRMSALVGLTLALPACGSGCSFVTLQRY
jgi:hypothetical protein